jgi:hypothetical protein
VTPDTPLVPSENPPVAATLPEFASATEAVSAGDSAAVGATPTPGSRQKTDRSSPFDDADRRFTAETPGRDDLAVRLADVGRLAPEIRLGRFSGHTMLRSPPVRTETKYFCYEPSGPEHPSNPS